jgi:hypothetical protein
MNIAASSYGKMNGKLFFMSQTRDLRQSQRFPIRMPVRFRFFGEGQWQQGRTVNVSSSGIFFRCQLSADRGTRIEMDFILPTSRAKDSGLEVACKGEVVRIEPPLRVDGEPSLAVAIIDYRLLPFVPGRTKIDDPFVDGMPEE